MEREEIWIRERLHPDFEHSTRAREKLVEFASKYQKIEIFDTDIFGKLLTLDGAVQTTEKDQAYYHELLVGIPFLLKGNVDTSLIIGGGDGGALHAMLSFGVKEAWLVELDEDVTRFCSKNLPEISSGAFDDPRTHTVFMDGFEFLSQKINYFDAILVDSPDPIGEAEKLYSDEFYRRIKASLKEGGVVAGQSGSPWLQPELGHRIKEGLVNHFKYVAFYYGFVPSYPGTCWLFFFASDLIDPFKVEENLIAERFNSCSSEFEYLNSGLVKSVFHLPEWIKKSLETGVW